MQLQRVRRLPWPLGTNDDRHASRGPDNDGARSTQSLVSQVLDYVGDHYTDRNHSLDEVATALKKNEKYITHLFAQRVGTRMRVYITMLRVQRACMLLLQTNQTIEEIARESGFAGTPQFRKAFRRAIGVTATEYRQIFASEAQPRTETQPS
jgi:AraC-like DNA-binding protein